MSFTDVHIPQKILPDGWEHRSHDPDSHSTFYRAHSVEYEVVIAKTGANEYDVALEGGKANDRLRTQETVVSAEGVQHHPAVACAIGFMQGAEYYEQQHLEDNL